MPKVTEKLFKLPVWERFITTDRFPCKIIILHIDEVGVCVEVGSETPSLTTDYLRCHLVGRRTTHAYIQAKDVREALDKFYSEYEGARTGGATPEERAQWIDESEPILEFPCCEHLHVNSEGQFTCGQPINENPNHWLYAEDPDNTNGDNGMCVIEGYDEPSDSCPIHQFYHKLSKCYDTVSDFEFGRSKPLHLHMIKAGGIL